MNKTAKSVPPCTGQLSVGPRTRRYAYSRHTHNTTFEDEDGRTALILAADKGLQLVVKILLEEGSDAKATGNDHQNALDVAAARGFEDVVQELLHKIEAHDLKQRALQLAAKGGHFAVAILRYESIKEATIKALMLPEILLSVAANPRHSAESANLDTQTEGVATCM